MTDQLKPNDTKTNRLAEIMCDLTLTQLRYVVARNECRTDKEAAETIGISPATVKGWTNKEQVDEAVRLMIWDGIITARELRRRNLAKAMAIKVAGLDSGDERLQQNVATEIIEGELGKPKQEVEQHNDGELVVRYVNDWRNHTT